MMMPQWVKTEVRGMLVYLVILLVMIELIDSKVGSITRAVNAYAYAVCVEKQQTTIRPQYNNFVKTMISQQETAEALNAAKHDTSKVTADAAYAAQLKADLVSIPHEDCSKPVLP